jgi:hypothetical protein
MGGILLRDAGAIALWRPMPKCDGVIIHRESARHQEAGSGQKGSGESTACRPLPL